mmetsp:Transcript_23233/g.52384  ORF Transcript_23233/g.52384 Transcript_23233/m.52384 type:complete len:228 (+) Transcript_23233:320-1003(+)
MIGGWALVTRKRSRIFRCLGRRSCAAPRRAPRPLTRTRAPSSILSASPESLPDFCRLDVGASSPWTSRPLPAGLASRFPAAPSSLPSGAAGWAAFVYQFALSTRPTSSGQTAPLLASTPRAARARRADALDLKVAMAVVLILSIENPTSPSTRGPPPLASTISLAALAVKGRTNPVTLIVQEPPPGLRGVRSCSVGWRRASGDSFDFVDDRAPSPPELCAAVDSGVS